MRQGTKEPLQRCFKVRIEGRERQRGFYQAYWTDAPSLGRAIERVLHVAEMCGVRDPIARAAEPLPDYLLLHEACCDSARDPSDRAGLLPPPEGERWPTPTADVQCAARCYFPAQARFVPPTGAIESCVATDLALARMRSGWMRRPGNRVVAMPAHDQLEPAFAALLELAGALRSVSVDWVWCRRRRLAWRATSTHMRQPGSFVQFVREHRASLLESGFVALSAVGEGGTRIRLDEHKVLFVATRAHQVELVERELRLAGLRARDSLTLIRDFPHHHFRPRGAFGMNRLRALLVRQGFEVG
ncbi:MAG TPA: hypothetical protein VK081_09350 [Planctomycetota bacterium]|nr:hypothetical protein [Planctomycetota bacterium]